MCLMYGEYAPAITFCVRTADTYIKKDDARAFVLVRPRRGGMEGGRRARCVDALSPEWHATTMSAKIKIQKSQTQNAIQTQSSKLVHTRIMCACVCLCVWLCERVWLVRCVINKWKCVWLANVWRLVDCVECVWDSGGSSVCSHTINTYTHLSVCVCVCVVSGRTRWRRPTFRHAALLCANRFIRVYVKSNRPQRLALYSMCPVRFASRLRARLFGVLLCAVVAVVVPLCCDQHFLPLAQRPSRNEIAYSLYMHNIQYARLAARECALGLATKWARKGHILYHCIAAAVAAATCASHDDATKYTRGARYWITVVAPLPTRAPYSAHESAQEVVVAVRAAVALG